jgi:hypothetical protein
MRQVRGRKGGAGQARNSTSREKLTILPTALKARSTILLMRKSDLDIETI